MPFELQMWYFFFANACFFSPPLACLNQLNKPAWYLMACELQLLEQYYGWGKSGALQWNSNSVWKLFVLVLVLQGLEKGMQLNNSILNN